MNISILLIIINSNQAIDVPVAPAATAAPASPAQSMLSPESQTQYDWESFLSFANSSTCGIPEYNSVEEGATATREHGEHSWIVRGMENAKMLTDHFKVEEIVKIYGQRFNHYTRTNGEGTQTVSEAWNDEKYTGIVGIVLNREERESFAKIFGPTNEMVSGYNKSELGFIVGKKKFGVINDHHLPVFFYHLSGYKGWIFSHDPVQEQEVSDLGASSGYCQEELFLNDDSHQACLLGPGDFLYAPAHLYHSTCHLGDTVALIQWDHSILNNGESGYEL
jgi:hypothetical protein